MKKLQDYPLTLKEVAHTLSCSCNAVRRFAAAGKLKSEKFGPLRELRFREDDVDEFAAKQDPAKLDRQLVQRIKSTEPHYQGTITLANR